MPDRPDAADLPAPDTIAHVARRLDRLSRRHPELSTLELDEVLRVVPGKRIILAGRFGGQAAVIRQVGRDGARTLGREWAELIRVHPKMQDGRYRVAQPLLYLPQGRLMITARVSGQPLLEHLWQSPPDQRAHHLRPAATWLRRYTASSESWGPGNAAGWLARAERAAATQPFAQLRRIEVDILDHLRQRATQLAGAAWRRAISHGDYHPNNLILGQDRLTGIDTGGSSKLPVLKDVARFLVHMGRRGMVPSGQQTFGVDAHGIACFAEIFALTDIERRLWLPFFIGIEALIRVENPGLKPGRIRHAETMYAALLQDLQKTP